MKGYTIDIETATSTNTNFRQVLYTSKYSQLVLMTLPPGEEIGLEVHPHNDQFFRIETGQAECVVDGHQYFLGDGDVLIVPAGANHNIINVSDTEALKLYTIYSPPHHQDGIIRATKAEAMSNSPEFDGVTSE